MGYMAQDKGMGAALRKQRVYGKNQKKSEQYMEEFPFPLSYAEPLRDKKAWQPATRHNTHCAKLSKRLHCCSTPPPPLVGCVWFPRLYATLFKQRKSLGLIYKRKSMAHALCTMH